MIKKVIIIYSFGFLVMAVIAVILVLTKLIPGSLGDSIIMIAGITMAILSFVISKKVIKK